MRDPGLQSLAPTTWHAFRVRCGKPLVPCRYTVTVIAKEQFIRTLAAHNDLDMSRGQARQEVEGDARRKGNRFILLPYEPWKRVEEFPGCDDGLVVFGAYRRRGHPRPARFVRGRVPESHRKSLDRFAHHGRHQRTQPR